MEVENKFQRPTVTIKLPLSAVEVTFKKWLTQEEAEQAQEPMLNVPHEVVSRPMGGKHGEDVVTQRKITGKVLHECEKKTIAIAVTMIDGDEKNIEARLNQLPSSDYQFLKTAINDEYTQEKKDPSEKSPS